MTSALRRQINKAGDLHRISGLAARWHISRQRAQQLVRLEGFPAPVRTSTGDELWFGAEADAFRAGMATRDRRTRSIGDRGAE